MPTENEKKFVLNKDCESKIIPLAKKLYRVKQGYLISARGISLRVRKAKSATEKHIFTLKCGVGRRVVEIEKKISERDFNDLWSQSVNKLEKIRYLVLDEATQLWEIDFFLDHNNEIYFCVAELEMPEGQENPHFIPHFIKNNLICEVGLTDSRFSSKLLADVRYAKNIYSQIRSNNA